MIRKVNLSEMQICSDVIRESFLPVALKFNITNTNKKVRFFLLPAVIWSLNYDDEKRNDAKGL